MSAVHASCTPSRSDWTIERRALLFELFRPLGGIAEGNVMAATLRDTCSQPLSVMGRWIVGRHVLHFSWHSALFVPLFQFQSPRPADAAHAPLPGMRRVLAELDAFFDEWEIAEWFATPNTWLQQREPARLVAQQADSVVQAARADRYIAKGW